MYVCWCVVSTTFVIHRSTAGAAAQRWGRSRDLICDAVLFGRAWSGAIAREKQDRGENIETCCSFGEALSLKSFRLRCLACANTPSCRQSCKTNVSSYKINIEHVSLRLGVRALQYGGCPKVLNPCAGRRGCYGRHSSAALRPKTDTSGLRSRSLQSESGNAR